MDIVERAKDYVERCGTVEGKKQGRFANLAGFCGELGVGLDTYLREMVARPEEDDAIKAILEDAALNSDLSATLVSAYLKARLGYGEKPKDQHACDSGQLQLIFEHDIYQDGG